MKMEVKKITGVSVTFPTFWVFYYDSKDELVVFQTAAIKEASLMCKKKQDQLDQKHKEVSELIIKAWSHFLF